MPSEVRTMSTAPALFAGVVTVTEVDEFTVSPVPAVPPKVTDVVFVRLRPVIVTVSLPAVGPPVGEIPMMAGSVSTADAAVSSPGPQLDVEH